MKTKPTNRETRKFHRKSRTGCLQCKQRHVKCDERKPSCSTCTQTGRDCSFLQMLPSIPTALTSNSRFAAAVPGSQRIPSAAPSPSGQPLQQSDSSTPGSTSSPLLSVSSSTPPSVATTNTAVASATSGMSTSLPINMNARRFSQYCASHNQPEFTLADLSLMHHWATEAGVSLTPIREAQQVCAKTAVQIALQHRFLLPSILATSALHIAYTSRYSSTKEYRELVNYALQRQNMALGLFRTAQANPAAAGPAENYREAIFMLSVLISVNAIATLRDELSDAMDIDFLTTRPVGAAKIDFKWIQLSRGILLISQDYMTELARGPVGPLLYSEVLSEPAPCIDEWREEFVGEDLRNLQNLWQTDAVDNSNKDTSGQHESHSLTFIAFHGETISISQKDRDAFNSAYYALRSTRSKVYKVLQAEQSETAQDIDRAGSSADDHNYQNTRVPSRHTKLGARIMAEIFFWLMRIPMEYIELLEQQHPVALIILAHYAAFLGTDGALWWTEKSAYMIIRRVWVALDEGLRRWIESPMADVRRANG